MKQKFFYTWGIIMLVVFITLNALSLIIEPRFGLGISWILGFIVALILILWARKRR